MGKCFQAALAGDTKFFLKIRLNCDKMSRGEEHKETERNPDFKARRWVVEVMHSFFNRFHKLPVRFEKKSANYLALVHFACAIIVWRKLISVYR